MPQVWHSPQRPHQRRWSSRIPVQRGSGFNCFVAARGHGSIWGLFSAGRAVFGHGEGAPDTFYY